MLILQPQLNDYLNIYGNWNNRRQLQLIAVILGQLTELVQNMVPVFHGLIRKSAEERNTREIEAARDTWSQKWAILNKHLKRNEYVGGANFTMADIPIGPIAYRWYELPIEREEYPDLYRWYKKLCDRSAFKKHIMTGLS